MKVNQLREILEYGEQIYRDAGSNTLADSLKELSALCVGHETKNVSAFVTLLAKAAEADRAT